MLYVYLVAAAALIPILDIPFAVLREPYSWWLVPVMYIGFVLAFVILHLAIFALSIQLTNPEKEYNKSCKGFRLFVKLSLPMLLKLVRVRIHTSGAEMMPEDTRFLLVCNHIHDLDPAIMINEFPDAELGFVGKKEIWTTLPFVAKAMQKLNCLPIDRENNREAVKTIISAAKLIEDDVCSIGIFPEGYTNKTEDCLLPLRNGAFKIAYKAKVPIVVCTVFNTPKIPKNLFIRPTDVYLDVLKVISASELEKTQTAQIGEEVARIMSENIEKRRSQENN